MSKHGIAIPVRFDPKLGWTLGGKPIDRWDAGMTCGMDWVKETERKFLQDHPGPAGQAVVDLGFIDRSEFGRRG